MTAAGNKHIEAFTKEGLLENENIILWQRAFRKDTSFEGVAILTNLRFVFFRKGTLSTKMEPYPISKISSVEARKGLMMFKLKVFTSGDDLELTLVGNKDASQALANRMQQALHQTPERVTSTVPPPEGAPDPMEQIERLGKLLEGGLLTKEEFDAKKAELLARL